MVVLNKPNSRKGMSSNKMVRVETKSQELTSGSEDEAVDN